MMSNSPDPAYLLKKKQRERLMAMAAERADWAVGYQDETWWSRSAQPPLRSWAEKGQCLKLHEHGACAFHILTAATGDAPVAHNGTVLLCTRSDHIEVSVEQTRRRVRVVQRHHQTWLLFNLVSPDQYSVDLTGVLLDLINRCLQF